MSLATSRPTFTAALTELGLTDLCSKFEANGWNDFSAFAFATSDPQGRDGKAFEQEVLPELVTMVEGKATIAEEKKLIP